MTDVAVVGGRMIAQSLAFVKIVPPTNNTIQSTWAIATRPQPQALWPQKALIWEASERDALTPQKTKRLEKVCIAYFRT